MRGDAVRRFWRSTPTSDVGSTGKSCVQLVALAIRGGLASARRFAPSDTPKAARCRATRNAPVWRRSCDLAGMLPVVSRRLSGTAYECSANAYPHTQPSEIEPRPQLGLG